MKSKFDKFLIKNVTNKDNTTYRNAIVLIDSPSLNMKFMNVQGIASAKTKENMTINHQFHIASVGKIMTATIIMQMKEEGLFGNDGLDATLQKLNVFPTEVIKEFHYKNDTSYGHKITLRHLLNHTSGLKNILDDDENGISEQYPEVGYYAPNSLGRTIIYDKNHGAKQLISCFQDRIPEGYDLIDYLILHINDSICDVKNNLIFHLWKPWDYEAWKANKENKMAGLLNFYLGGMNKTCLWEPGYKYYYSDLNYILLGLIIEKLSGNSLHHELRKRIFDPLGMDSTYLGYSTDPASENWKFLLSDYWIMGIPAESIGLNRSFDWGGGGQVSTITDLNKFIRALTQNKLFKSDETLEEMLTYPFNLYKNSGYGCGLYIITKRDNKIIGHTGANGTWLLYDIKNEISCIGTVNEEGEKGYKRMIKLLTDIQKLYKKEKNMGFLKDCISILKYSPR